MSMIGLLIQSLALVLLSSSAAPAPASHCPCVDHGGMSDGLTGYWTAVQTDPCGCDADTCAADEEDNDLEDHLALPPAPFRITFPVHFAPVAAERSLTPISPGANPRAPRSPPTP
jgi:hypothetical protein